MTKSELIIANEKLQMDNDDLRLQVARFKAYFRDNVKYNKPMSTTNKLTVRVIVEQGTSNPVERGCEVEYIGTVNFDALAMATLDACLDGERPNCTIDGQQVINVTQFLQPQTKTQRKSK